MSTESIQPIDDTAAEVLRRRFISISQNDGVPKIVEYTVPTAADRWVPVHESQALEATFPQRMAEIVDEVQAEIAAEPHQMTDSLRTRKAAELAIQKMQEFIMLPSIEGEK